VQAETSFQGSQALFSDPNLKVLVFKSPAIRELFLATDQDPWKDYRVRQAFALCLDRPTINKALFDGRSTLGYDSFWNPDVYVGMPANVVRSQDHDKAKQLLTEAGHADGLSVTLSTPNFLEMPQYAQLVQQQCRPAGITVKIQTVDYNAWYAGGPEDAPWLNASAGIVEWAARPTPSVYVQAMLLPDSAWNSSHWDDKEFAATFDEYVATVDEASRMDMATQLSQMQQDQTPIVVSFFVSNLRAMKKNVYGVLGPGESYIDVAQAYIA
jgi:peptide/nickel transport system substrate-binding protein